MEHRDVFDPSTSTRVFRISGTDVGQVVILPRLMNHLREVAPGVLVDYSNFSTQTVKQLESGDVDLALGFIPPLNTGFHRQRLFAEHFVCVARAGHPRIRKILTLDAFQQEFHLAVKTSGTGHQALDAALEAQGIRCRVGLRVPNYLGVATLIANTDLLVTVPSRLACVISSLVKVRVFPPPVAVEPYAVMQYWHARADKDAGNRWLRGVIAELFNDARKGGLDSSSTAATGVQGRESRNRTER
jgi:DNA-binding transcriptional LysR family regulator